MGESVRRLPDWQAGATSVRDRMDHLYNNPDMADLHISAVDEQWLWGQTSKDFIGHKLVLCTASPIFHQLFYPTDTGPDIPPCLTLSRNGTNGTSKLEVDGVPPIAIEALLEYCYKDRFNKSDFENGYSRNLLWRLWHIARLLHINHLFELCAEALDSTMCEESVYWDLNYSMRYQEMGTEGVRSKVNKAMESLGNALYNHPNFVFLDQESIRTMLTKRIPASSEALIVFNNVLRWALYQLDRTLCEEVDGKKDSDIPVSERCRMVNRVRQEKVKDFTCADINKYLDRVLDLVPYSELSQNQFLEHVVPGEVLPKEMLLSASLSVMEEVVKNPERLSKSAFLWLNDPNTVKSELNKVMDSFRVSQQADSSPDYPGVPGNTQSVPGDQQKFPGDQQGASPRTGRDTNRREPSRTRDSSSGRQKGDIKTTLEAARQRRLALENSRVSKNIDADLTIQQSNLLLVE